MSLLGTYLTVLIGPSVPVPAPATLLELLDSVEVTHSDSGPSGFQLGFKVGRGPTDILDYAALVDPLLRPFSRVVLIVTFGAVPEVLMDGLITRQELRSGSAPGTGLLTVTGEDVSYAMDLEERSVEHPAQDETVIALKIIASYAQYGLIPSVIPPPAVDVPIPTERTPVQQGTDLQYLKEMAQRHGYVFYVSPGPVPLMNTAYWGPPERVATPQRALSINMGGSSTAMSLDFQLDGRAASFEEGVIRDRITGANVPVKTFASTRVPLVSQPAWLMQSGTRTRQFRASGLNAIQAYARAQAQTDRASDRVVTGTGELDTGVYQGLLKARGVVGVRGAGYTYDGWYYVEQVTHSIRRGEYRQRFTISREGVGALTPVVVP